MTRPLRRHIIFATSLLVAARCALYSDVSIEPLNVIPSKIERGADLRQHLVEEGERLNRDAGLGLAEISAARLQRAT